jgi:group I intron endonuclease
MELAQERNYCVYMHTSPNNKVYIGITGQNPPEKRWANGRGYKNSYFYNAIQKYGWDNIKHEILYIGLTKEEAEQNEVELIKKYQSDNREFGYNIERGGNSIGKMPQETKDKISKANMGNQFSLGYKHTEESRMKMSEASKKALHPKGIKMPEHVKQILAESHKTEEFRRKLSEANLGKKHSDETKKKLSESHKGLGSKKVICIETGVVYDSIKEASEKNNIKGRGHISACCKGGRMTAGGYHWEYYKEVS